MKQLDHLLLAPTYPTRPLADLELTHEHLPFAVRIVQTDTDLSKAVQIRHSAYARHVPTFAQSLLRPEPIDTEIGAVILLAESKLNGGALGTMRIQTNCYRPLTIEQSLDLPAWLQGKVLAEATRLGVTDDRCGRVVKTALFKAFYQYCHQAGVEWMVVAGRAPIDRQYERLLFEDVYSGQGFIPLQHAGNMPHRVMALRVPDVEPKWKQARHPLYDYFFRTVHPDISTNVDGDVPAEIESVPTHSVESIDEAALA